MAGKEQAATSASGTLAASTGPATPPSSVTVRTGGEAGSATRTSTSVPTTVPARMEQPV